MKINRIRHVIRDQLLWSNTSNPLNMQNATIMAQKIAIDAHHTGHEYDADAIIAFAIANDSVSIALFAGRTLLVGKDINDYLLDYHDYDDQQAEYCVESLTDSAISALKTADVFLAVLRDLESVQWRAFRGVRPLSLSEIKTVRKRTLQ